MKHVPAAEANRRFSKLLGAARRGQTIVITSHGVPIACLTPFVPGKGGERDEARELARKQLWARLRKQPVLNLGKMTRDEIYEEIL